MNQWDELRHECPRLYKNPIVFECGPGWFDIIHDLSVTIEAVLDYYADKHKAAEIEMYATQIKEKYGTLRFYMSCKNDEICKLIAEAESVSSQTCENCGAPGRMRGVSWYLVRCDKCYGENK